MFISFPAMVYQWVKLVSLASSLRNDALSDKHVESIAKSIADVKGIIRFLLDELPYHLQLNWQGLHP